MKKALLFREDREPILVTAEEVKEGKYRRDSEFVDPEYEFKVQFVRGARNNGGPYFRLYYSYEEYKKLYPDRASRYEIVANMRRYQESEWHRAWKEKMRDFCVIEKSIKHPSTKKWKIADVFYEKTQTCIEFQHSYIALDFEERNKFYSDLSIDTIWLYDLPKANVREDDQGNIEILEDNARGFFRIAENPNNLKNYRVYIQVKIGEIYRVTELLRRESSNEKKSTIRYFVPVEAYTEQGFINAIKNNDFKIIRDIGAERNEKQPKSIQELWDKPYKWMILKNVETEKIIYINCNHRGDIYRDFSTDCIRYKYVNDEKSFPSSKKDYPLSHQEEKKAVWIRLKAEV